MKNSVLLILVLLSHCLIARQSGELHNYSGKSKEIYPSPDICFQLGFAPDTVAEKTISSIMEQIGLKPNFLLRQCDHYNGAAALTISDPSIKYARYIVYDSQFLSRLSNNAETDWAAVSVFAHEVAHHLYGHTYNSANKNHEFELRCDRFSGFALQKLGATLEQALAGMNAYGYKEETSTHPAIHKRLEAIREGWQDANQLAAKFRQDAKEADYQTIAKKWFLQAYNLNGETKKIYLQKIALYTSAINIKEDYWIAYRNRAKYFNKLKQYSLALEDADQVIAINPTYWNAYAEKGAAHFGLEEYEEALEAFSKAIEGRQRPHANDYAARGWIYHRKGNRKAAKKDLEKAIELRPGWQDAINKLKVIRRGK